MYGSGGKQRTALYTTEVEDTEKNYLDMELRDFR